MIITSIAIVYFWSVLSVGQHSVFMLLAKSWWWFKPYQVICVGIICLILSPSSLWQAITDHIVIYSHIVISYHFSYVVIYGFAVWRLLSMFALFEFVYGMCNTVLIFFIDCSAQIRHSNIYISWSWPHCAYSKRELLSCLLVYFIRRAYRTILSLRVRIFTYLVTWTAC